MTQRIVAKAKEYDRDTIPGDYATLETPCPNCGGIVKENYRRFTCTGAAGNAEGCGFSISKIPGGRSFELDEVETFLADKKIGPLEGFRSQGRLAFHRRAEARVRRRDRQLEARVRLRRGRPQGRRVRRAGRLLRQQSLGACPKCQGHVYEHGTSYVCEHSVGAHVTCDFKSGKIILQQPVAREQMTKLLAEGKTDLLENFVSNKTRRKFKARLAYDKKEGKVIFEFEPRAAKAPAKKAAAKKTAS
jgi:DNA topoisomerase-3